MNPLHSPAASSTQPVIRTPDQRVRVFVSSTPQELARERAAVHKAISALCLTPVMSDLGARPHSSRAIYRAYLQQSDVFIALYWQRYGRVAPGMVISEIEDEYNLSSFQPRLIYIKSPARRREAQLQALIERVHAEDTVSYKSFSTPEELRNLVENDLALLLTESFEATLPVLAAPAKSEQRAEDTPAAAPARHDNLPVLRTQLVGRNNELAAVKQLLLRPDVALVTLAGPGGSGKTRLALQLGGDLGDQFRDGVYLVPLAPVTDPNLVAPAIARVLDVREAKGKDVVDGLEDYLRDKHLLLILDNSEHLPTVGPLVVQLLDRCPRLTVLVTSRQPLRVRGEKEFPVPPLDVPAVEEMPPLDSLEAYSAVELFVQRAREVRPGFALDEGNARAVVEICRRLDGLPLAIELAAARIRLLTPQAILARLENRLQLLTGGARDLPARQQTLRSTIDWSYNLLKESERRLFARLAVFPGGCTLDAAGEVCGAASLPYGAASGGQTEAEEPDWIAVLEGLGSLVDKSLLIQQEQKNGEPRFSMLETIREYALERLEAIDEEDQIRQRHADFYLRLAEAAAKELSSPNQAESLACIELERENLRGALAWCIKYGAEATGLRLAGALWRFWYLRGRFTEGRQWLKQMLDLPGSAGHTPERAKALNGAGGLAHSQGDYPEALALLEESLAISRELGDKQGMAATNNNLGMLAGVRGDYAQSNEFLQEALALNRALGDRSREAANLNNLGYTAHRQGDFSRARHLQEDSLAIFTQLGDQWGVSQVLTDLGDLLSDSADYVAAEQTYRRTLTLQEELGDRRGSALTLMSLAQIAWKQGEYAPARDMSQQALACFRDLGDKKGIATALNFLGNVSLYQGDDEGAGSLYRQSLTMRRELGDRRDLAATYNNLGLVATHQGDLSGAQTLIETAVMLWREVGDRERIATSLSNLGRVALGVGDLVKAKALFEEARGLARDQADKWSYGYALSGLAQAAIRQERHEEAALLLVEVIELRKSVNDLRGIARSLLGFAWLARIRGDHEREAKLLGTAEALRVAIGAGWEPALRRDLEQAAANARSRLGEAIFTAAWAEGRALTIDEAIAYALEEAKDVEPAVQ